MATIEIIENNLTFYRVFFTATQGIGKRIQGSVLVQAWLFCTQFCSGELSKEPEEQHGLPRSARIITWRVHALAGAGGWGS